MTSKNVFWFNNPKILFDNIKYSKFSVTELTPNFNSSFEEKLNYVSRIVIILSIIGFILTLSIKYILFGIMTLVIIIFIYYFKKQKIIERLKSKSKEGYINLNDDNINNKTFKNVLKENFYNSNKKNPFGNVLLTEIQDKPERKAAPPSFNVDVSEDITKNIKDTVQYLNPTIKNTNKQLYGDLWQNFELDQSNRVFYSNPNTKVVNDQGAFGKYLYGNMPSAKEGDPFSLVQDNYRYILI